MSYRAAIARFAAERDRGLDGELVRAAGHGVARRAQAVDDVARALTLGRVIGYPGEVEAGIVTAFVGAPVLVIIARRTRMRAL